VKVIISGASGFVGNAIARTLLSEGCQLVLIVRRSTNKVKIGANLYNHSAIVTYDGSFESLDMGDKVSGASLIIHLASETSYEHTPEKIASMVEANILLGNHLLELSKKYSIKSFINTSSYWQGDYNGYHYSLYAAMKSSFEAIIDYYVDSFDINVISLVLYDTYGPFDSRKKVLHYLINEGVLNQSLVKLGSLDKKIPFVHISDVVSAYKIAADQLMSGKTLGHSKYSVFSGHFITLGALVKIISRYSGIEVSVVADKALQRNRAISYSKKFSAIRGWVQSVDIEDGIQEILKIKGCVKNNVN
jgi:CDP-3, 6-dideoxy-D-glycero-L-glycero-4-hexulose-4-reductase